ncbi:MAG TPA: phage terminase large subunit family protein, partial [Planctomycetota bacterium]|nr:phage terminase large subunit family protein [Planctomycetota bacterium]
MPTATADLPGLKLPRFGSERAAVAAMRRSAVPPRTELTVSEWADQFRILDKSAAEPGRWRTDRNPIGRGIMNAFTNAAVQTIVLMGCTQLIKTEAMLNMLGYAIDQNPGPTLWVCPP